MTIRKLIKKMQSVYAHNIYFYNHEQPIIVRYGNPNDDYSSYSYWKTIEGTPVCRDIDCYIPKGLQIPEIEKYRLVQEYDDFILPEKWFNLILSCNRMDDYRTLSAPYYMMVDTMG